MNGTQRRAALVVGCLATLAVVTAGSVLSGQRGAPSRPTAQARLFATELRIEIDLRPGQQSADALAAALREGLEVSALVDPDGEVEGGLGELNRSSAPTVLDERVFDALQRALAFCVWSQQAHGPLGGNLYAAWGLRKASGGRPDQGFLQQQLEFSYCERLELDPETSSGTLAPGSRADLWGFERGFAIDQMVEVLREHGVDNGYVQLGEITRGFGPGPGEPPEAGAPPTGGWVVAVHPGGDERIDRQFIVLNDQSLSLASRQVQTLVVDGEAMPPYVDQRTGQLISGKLAVAAVTEQAIDAEALSVALFVMSSREGEFRLGALEPQPSARWYLGSGSGFPLITERGWARLRKWKPSDNPFRNQLQR